MQKSKLERTEGDELHDDDDDDQVKLERTEQFRWLDRAAVVTTEDKNK